VARDVRMLPRRVVKRRLVARAVGGDRREGVRLGGEGAVKRRMEAPEFARPSCRRVRVFASSVPAATSTVPNTEDLDLRSLRIHLVVER
jgi:hypothetical protein